MCLLLNGEISEEQVNRIAQIFTNAFFDYPLYRYLYPVENSRRKKLIQNFKPLIRYGILCRGLYTTSENYEGFLVILKGLDAYFPIIKVRKCKYFRSILTSGLRFLLRSKNLKNHFPSTMVEFPDDKKEDINYLMYICVDPVHQGKGFARKLLTFVLDNIDPKTNPCYIETYLPRNVEIYKKAGFKLIKEASIKGLELKNWSLRR